MHVALWIVQIVLALLFLFAGGSKFVMSAEQMNQGSPMTMSPLFLRFIGVCELLGGLGLVLPGLFGVRPGLTPLAAAGLVIIMMGATVITMMMGGGVTTLVPLVVGILALWIAYARWQVLPLRTRG